MRQIKKQQPKMVIIEGHTDQRGSRAYNMLLSERRARVVGRYLKDQGIDTQLKYIAGGEEADVSYDHSLANAVYYRRVIVCFSH